MLISCPTCCVSCLSGWQNLKSSLLGMTSFWGGSLSASILDPCQNSQCCVLNLSVLHIAMARAKTAKDESGVGAQCSSATFKLMYGSFATVGGAMENLNGLFGDNYWTKCSDKNHTHILNYMLYGKVPDPNCKLYKTSESPSKHQILTPTVYIGSVYLFRVHHIAVSVFS